MTCPLTPQCPNTAVAVYDVCLSVDGLFTGLALFASAVAAIIGVWINARLHRSFERNSQSRKFLIRDPSNARISILVDKYRLTPYREIKLSDRRIILEHYEYICAGIRHGDVDERLIYLSERPYVVRIYEKFEEYIEFIQSQPQAGPKSFENLQIMAKRWDLTYKRGPLQLFDEFFRHKPNFVWTKSRLNLKNKLGIDLLVAVEWAAFIIAIFFVIYFIAT